MDGLEAALRREPNVLRAVRIVKNRLPDTQANRNHMNVVLADFRANINTILDELLVARQSYYPEDQVSPFTHSLTPN